MATELVGPCAKGDNMYLPTIPPGFESLAPFTVNRAEDNQVTLSTTSDCATESQTETLQMVVNCNDDLKTSKCSRRRPWIKYCEFDNNSGDESESEKPISMGLHLPKGVIRGCEKCSSCQKVIAKWRPEASHRPDLQEAPVFYPSEEEFEDTLKYIASIRSKAETYGICRIVPPASWKPPCPLKEKNMWERSKFVTRVQRIEKLQNRDSMRKIFQVNYNKRKRKRKSMKNEVDYRKNDEEVKITGEVERVDAERFGFEHGPEFTMDEFKKYSDEFVAQYFRKNSSTLASECNINMFEEQWQPTVESIEGEYWRMVEKPTEEIEVLYGADLETGVFGSGFPKTSHQVCSASDMKYVNSGWNLNNFPRLPGSVLSFESSEISGVLVPWLYIGMCFSSFCWHVEDHHLYSLNYMHWGAPKLWYGVPGSDAVKLEAAMRKHLPDLFEEQPDLLHKLVTQLSPSILKSEGVPVYRCVQNQGEFILTFPRAYHAGFNCGFNCAEAVNVAPVDWLPHGQNAIELYCEQGRKSTISHDKLLLGAAREAVKANWEYNLLRKYTRNNLRWKDVCGKDGILSKALKARVEMERLRRDFLCKSSQALKMESSFDANSERECSICLFDLHLSAAGCHHCSPDKYACLNHAKQLCSCSWGAKFFLFRYDIGELNLLVEALEGKLSAIYRWARLDLGLALSSYVSKDNLQSSGVVGQSSSHNTSQEAPKETSSLPTTLSSIEQMDGRSLNVMKFIGSTNSYQKEKPSEVVLALESVKPSSILSSPENEASKHNSPCHKKNNLQSTPRIKILSPQPSQVSSRNASSEKNVVTEKPLGKQSLANVHKDVILLTDVEGEGPNRETFLEDSEQHRGNVSKPVCDPVSCLNNPSSTAAVVGPADKLDRVKHGSSSECIKAEERKEGEANLGDNSLSNPCFKVPSDDADSCKFVSVKKETAERNEANACLGFNPQNNKGKSNDEDNHKKSELEVDSTSSDNLPTVSTNPFSSQINLDRYYRQKGPRIAKVVRRINCNVEPLKFGSVHAGKQWCDCRAIYPNGFRSRVRYIDVLDPSNMCYYVSEILDAGRDGPLFMVSLERCPSEIFVHVSAARCWEMVRERVNHEITKQHKLGRQNLPPLQPPGSLDGMEMFGFSSPPIVQAIQAMDQNRVCSNYWKSRPLMQIPQQSQSGEGSGTFILKYEPLNDQEIEKNHPGVVRILNCLFKKANLEELHTLHRLLHNENSTDEQRLVTRLLNEKIHEGSA
ncbi:putative lysine-specific demethylase JMJ16 isoform X1 [Primulina huaijiensis]|uniref:putative lysine-specific demethylase JMJ16 isoform X1 n=2 Tax=Primulina huaijiensis TaxID=1492673 RepID=UPI003CC7689F